ncbi:hypothetical protein LDENG_00229960 [Lucifuga dentata]|nr:hypothetical protein LDENG_00229960 [Lucifuga dentata]
MKSGSFKFFDKCRSSFPQWRHTFTLRLLLSLNNKLQNFRKKKQICSLFAIMDYLSQEHFKYQQVDFNSRMN